MLDHSTAGSLRRRLVSLGAGLALLLPAATVVAPATALAAGGHMVPSILSGNPRTAPLVKPAAGVFGCQLVKLDDLTNGPACYGPDQIRAAYGIDKLINNGDTGRGRTIVIVDAFGNPYIQGDLALFDAQFGLPDPVFSVITMPGTPAFDFTNGDAVGWSAEISLDVQWAHAIAPAAHIDLVVSKSDQDADILAATRYAVNHNLGDVISQSFGEGESCVAPSIESAEHAVFGDATRKGITLIASSGDDGAAQPTCDGSGLFQSASSPAADPLVTGVGATNLQADGITGAYASERAWADAFTTDSDGNLICYPPKQFGCSGGGFSTIYGRPSYQEGVGVPRGARGVPDVAYNGGVDGGVLAHWGVGLAAIYGIDPNTPAFFIFGGTSAGSPQWAGLVALTDQLGHHRIGAMNDALYAIARSSLYKNAFHDITSGNNNFETVSGFKANKGWDPVTGLGTPKANILVPLLAFSF